MAALYEQHRPRTLDKIVGQDKAVAQAKRVLSRSWGARAWWITGDSGTGKTTMAYAIAHVGADDLFIEELDATRLDVHAKSAISEAKRVRKYLPVALDSDQQHA